jgi:hypothetical protein
MIPLYGDALASQLTSKVSWECQDDQVISAMTVERQPSIEIATDEVMVVQFDAV